MENCYDKKPLKSFANINATKWKDSLDCYSFFVEEQKKKILPVLVGLSFLK